MHITGVIVIFLDGMHISLSAFGAGEDVLMLHGYLSCKESFFYNSGAISQFYKVTVPDFPGFGGSSPLDSAWSVGDYAEWTARFINAAKLSRPHIIAHSFGARVAIKLAAERPQLVSKLIITGGAGLVKPKSRAYRRRVALYRAVKKFAPSFAETHFGSAEYRRLSPVMKESYKKIVNEDLRAEAARVAAPVLLIYGREDTVTPADEEGKVFSSVMGARLVIIEGGHFCFSQNAETFNRLALGFLSGVT